MVDTSIAQPTRHLLVIKMADVPNNFGLLPISVTNEDRSQWYEAGLPPRYKRSVGEILPAYSDEPYEQTLMRHGCTWVQATTAPLSTEQKQQLNHAFFTALKNTTPTSDEVISAINDFTRTKMQQADDLDVQRTAFIEQVDKAFGPVICHTAGLDRIELNDNHSQKEAR